MKQSVNYHAFEQAFRDHGRYDQFGYAALCALFDYLEELEQDIGEEMELDVIALCCDWTAYSSAVEACKELAAAGEPTEATRTVYTAGWNMPGYMPDSEPAQFDDIEDAREYIADMLDMAAEQHLSQANHSATDPEQAAQDLEDMRRIEQVADQVREGSGELGVTVAGWHYWITAETVENEDAEEQCLEWLQDQTQVIEYNGGILVGAF